MAERVSRYEHDVALQFEGPFTVNFSKELASGQTVSSAAAYLENPSGTVSPIDSGSVSVSSPSVTVHTGPFTSTGLWKMNLVATFTGSPAPKSTFRLEINVSYDSDG